MKCPLTANSQQILIPYSNRLFIVRGMNTGTDTLPGCSFTANQFCCVCKDNVRLVSPFTYLKKKFLIPNQIKILIQKKIYIVWSRLRMLQPHLPRQQRLPPTPRSKPLPHAYKTQTYHTKPGAINKHHSAPTTT